MAQLEYVYVTNFKYFRGCKKFGPFAKLTAIHGDTGVGKSIMIEAVAFAFGEKPENLGVADYQGLIHERANVCSITLVITTGKNVTTRFTKNVVQEEDEDGNLLPRWVPKFFLDDDVVEEEDYIEELTRAKILTDRKCFVVHNSRNHITYEDPMAFGDYFQDVFDLNGYKSDFLRIKRRLTTIERRKTQLDAVEAILNEEADKMVIFYIAQIYLFQKMIEENERLIASRHREINQLSEKMVPVARRPYFKSQAHQDILRFQTRMASQHERLETTYREANDSGIPLPKIYKGAPVTLLTKFELDYSVLPQDRVKTGRGLQDFINECRDEVNEVRRRWPRVNRIPADEYYYTSYPERKKAHDLRMAPIKAEYDELKAQLAEIKAEYSTLFKEKMRFFQDALSEMHKQVYHDRLRRITFELEDENDVSEGIVIVSHTKNIPDQPILQLSGGEKKLIELAVIYTIAEMNETPFLFIDNLDNNFHYKTFPHLLRFLKDKSKNQCQTIVVCRNSPLYRHIPERIHVKDDESK
uniref:SMC_N domain-containing protein n=1 Tax=Caenorhabditis tropicalis TaxID=1561998 RepID=A0A1I7UF36_9PELO